MGCGIRMGAGERGRERIRSPHTRNEPIGCCEAGDRDNFSACAAQQRDKQLMGPLIFVIDMPSVQQTRAPRKPGSKVCAGCAIETGP